MERKSKEGKEKVRRDFIWAKVLCLVPFEILGVSSLGLPALGRPFNLEGTRCKTLLLCKFKLRVVCKHLQWTIAIIAIILTYEWANEIVKWEILNCMIHLHDINASSWTLTLNRAPRQTSSSYQRLHNPSSNRLLFVNKQKISTKTSQQKCVWDETLKLYVFFFCIEEGLK